MSEGTSPAARVLIPLCLVGLAGAVGTYVVAGPERFFINWLIWFLFLLTIGLGGLFIVALEHTVASLWSVPVRRIAERLSGLVVGIVPVALIALFSLPVVFPWTHPEAAAEPMVAGKLVWLNIPWFVARMVISLILWVVCYRFLAGGSLRQDETKDPAFTLKARRFAPVVLIIFAFTLTNVAFDWISSLEPLWYSDIFGVYLFVGTFLAGLASTALGVAYLDRRGRLPGLRFDHRYNLGGLVFAFTVFWSYIAFAQYMLQWYANMPEEVFWYKDRIEGFWWYAAILLALLHFAIPFLALATRKAKGNLKLLARIAVVVLAAHFLDLFWMIFPVLGPEARPSWPELAFALLFIPAGLLWARWAMRRGADMPVGDPRLEAALEFRL